MSKLVRWISCLSLLTLLPVFWCAAREVDSTKRIALLVSDNYSKPVVDAIAALEQIPEFSSGIKVITVQAGHHEIAEADVVVCYVHTPQVIERFVQPMQQVVRRGGAVYAVGSTPEAANYSKWGMQFDPVVDSYFENPSSENIVRLAQLLADRHMGMNFQVAPAIHFPDYAISDWRTGEVYTDFDTFASAQGERAKKAPWVGIYGFRYEFITGQDGYLKEYAKELTAAGFNVLMFYGFPLEKALRHFCMEIDGKPRIEVLINCSSLPGGAPDKLAGAFDDLGVPVINAITLSQSLQEWRKSTVGIPISERILSMVRPEIMGQIQPSVIATKEDVVDSLGNRFKQKVPLPGRVGNMVAKVKAWHMLRHLPNAEKDVTLIYYNGHPGKHNIGASYLNVLPKSMFSILHGLQGEGYKLGNQEITEDLIYKKVMDGGRNVGSWAPGELDRMVKEDRPVLVPMKKYKKWFSRLAPRFQHQVVEKWGPPDSANIMVWIDDNQQRFLVLPQVRFGNINLMPQPARGWEENEEALFHDVSLPPHHQYIAFYLYLQQEQKSHALIHLGTHGTLEWLSGREAGLDQEDAPDALLGSMVNIYPYIMDNVGEGTQAKRRGGAVIIDHMTPPFQQSGLRPELRQLAGAINDYTAADQKSPILAASHLKAINRWAVESGVIRDLAITGDIQAADVQSVEHYLQELNEKQSPMGMHTFGVSPDSAHARLTAVAMAGRHRDISVEKREVLVETFFNNILESGPSEMRSLLEALEGKYITPGTGNDPLRNPEALPTGKNFYAFDPSRMPTQETYAEGRKLAEELLAGYRKKHEGTYPNKVAYNLWSVETIRHEGIMESQILYLLGVRPRYEPSGKIKGVELIPRDSLGRPRVDVVMTPSGLYRDMFPQMMSLLDQAVTLTYESPEADNAIRSHADSLEKQLSLAGVEDADTRKRLALVRMFGAASGSYGIGVDDMVQASDKWNEAEDIANVYFNRSGHLYGQGFWGTGEHEISELSGKNIALSLFKQALSGTKAVVHSRSTNVYGALDNDDFFQYLGGMSLAIKSIDGSQPDIMVSNLTDPATMKQETLQKFIGRELNTRYLNPTWITEMLDEGYAGARMVGQVTDNMWGWTATTEGVITTSDWQEWHDVYVADKYGLDIKSRFANAKNTYAYQNMLVRMLEVARKKFWAPDEQTLDNLVAAYLETVEQTGLSCSDQVCGNEELYEFVNQQAAGKEQRSKLSSLQEKLGRIHNSAKPARAGARQSSVTHSSREARNIAPRKSQANKPASVSTEHPELLKGYKMEEREVSSNSPRERQKSSSIWWISTVFIIIFSSAMAFSKNY